MKGFYIYCVRGGAGPEGVASRRPYGVKKIKSKGVDFGSRAEAFSFQDIEAIASEIDLSKFNAKTIKEKLQEDAKWTEKNVKRHHEVIAEAEISGAVIPMKFGTLYKTRKNLEAMLKKHYTKFKALLLRLKDKQEWGVKGYLEYKKFSEILKNKNKELKTLEKKRSSVPEGMKWYVDRKSDELVAGQIEREAEDRLSRIIDQLEKQAAGIRLNDFLPKEVSEPGKDMILNAACLVSNDRLEAFQSLLRSLIRECDAEGITLILTGPWPPYNFVDIKDEKA
ncbi:MAG: hypothetical protein A3G49_05070 [Candidatus Sungbacteria bacterium RIFCSPLOWO2_12_FULL_41_11]|uniref:Gas vesicle synthesis GvpLGvpF n=1 Tax=Candidatus Sungbacteria bacterium RIFCSPLOWO2_12_FULL_41_11 TaxID=1802286 RepID=A0A1G2LRU5_9BACT|nr:MAG: hypothetical protein UV01_C0003G0010 [Parcubacteria group bacterium GW2011_GWA2_42_14]OGZ98640.1 MAG: hypothetical protein A3D41_01650 [Candidatus Sungbacteria bacterium RIFCSPHIGHO2_02_FULL_41_12b]OHA14263.1 MAG: hypothetical protein A3G49_05070 [Candidatus Sungbacteria bacterium RIFCSPLOWO2_12_FULL_41_11]